MAAPKPVTVDFETFEIQGRPAYPPKPVGVSIKPWGGKARYYAWGHPSANNCSWGEAKKVLSKLWPRSGETLLFQNGKFDLDVAEAEFRLRVPSWEKVHDTLFLLFLDDPHQKELSLKPSAHRLLGWPAEEQDAVADWLVQNQPLKAHGITISRSRESDHYFAKYIAYAPGDLVGKYANGDVERTEAIFKLLYKKTVERGMLQAYDRERKLMPMLLEMERQGVRVDTVRLEKDVQDYRLWHERLTAWIVKDLKAPQDINLSSGPQLVEALIKAGKVDKEALGVTEKGRVQTNKEALKGALTDKRIQAALQYRSQLHTCLQTFMEGWLDTAKRSNGLIFTTWNQVKGERGTRTGRLSSTPNFQNIPKEFQPIWRHEKPKDKSLPICPLKLPTLPLVRSYIIPFAKDEVLLDRDYSQQELRVLAHFEDGVLADSYKADPWMDVHDHAKGLINQMTGKDFPRKIIKNTGFGLIYGMGVGLLAEKSEITVELAREVKDAYLAIFPGLKQIYMDMKMRMIAQKPIRTWGGREYFCEAAKIIDGRAVTFDYKLINYLVQGSSADCTKEAILRYWPKKHKLARLLINVHDEILVSVPSKLARKEMQVLREAMESIEFDIPMLSEGSASLKNWSALKDYDKKGELCPS